MGDSKLLFYVNGKRVIDDNVDPEETLLYYLRHNLHLTGTKSGCGEGGCGACTVMVSSFRDGVITHRAVNACLAPICSVHYCAVTTVEGIGSTQTRLHRVQRALVASHGSQCGFCTPGIVMSMYTLMRNVNQPTHELIERALQGNLCRCTGYRPILQGFSMFSPGDTDDTTTSNKQNCPMGEACCKKQGGAGCSPPVDNEDTTSNQFLPPCPTQEPIFPAELKVNSNSISPLMIKTDRMTWWRPNSLEAAFALKRNHPNMKIINGNTECGVELKYGGNLVYTHQMTPVAIDELTRIDFQPGSIAIGAAATLTEIDIALRRWIDEFKDEPKTRIAKAIVDMLVWFAGDQIRNVSSLGGNLMTASPISDMAQILMAAGAWVEYGNNSSSLTTLTIDEHFFTGYRKTKIPDECMLVRIHLPYCSSNAHFMAYKQSKRKEDDIAIVNSAFFVEFDEANKKVTQFRAAYGGMGPTTRLAVKSNALMVGADWSDDTLNKVTAALADEFQLAPNVPGGFAAYRQCLVTSLFFKFFLTIQHRLNGEDEIEQSIQRPETQWLQTAHIVTHDAVGKPVEHRSAAKQATGEAEYMDDLMFGSGEGYFAPLQSTCANGRIVSIDWEAALNEPGVMGKIDHTDVNGENATSGCGLEKGDDEFMRSTHVTSCGQLLGGIIATSSKLARRAVKLVKVQYERIDPIIVTVEDAIKYESYHDAPALGHSQGDVVAGLANATHTLESHLRMGGQEHFYFETHACMVKPVDNGNEMEVHVSCQNLEMCQSEIAKVLDMRAHNIHVRAKRLGGGFGGKETRFALLAGCVAVAAAKFNVPVRCMLERDEDTAYSGGRHPFLTKYKVGFESDGRIDTVDMAMFCGAGYSLDISMGMMSRAVDHCFNCYHFPNLKVEAKLMRTNLPSNTAFRGFGGPQGMLVAEDIICKVARVLNMSADHIRQVNFLKVGDRLPYGPCDMSLLTDEHILKGVYEQCEQEFSLAKRREEVAEFNATNKWKKRGLALVPTMFGIAFGLKWMNQGGALVHIYRDGSILVSHGGIEMGQGLHTKMAQIASKCLGAPIELIHTSETSTTQVPNASPTAASFSSDINGWAVKNACEQLQRRLQTVIDRNEQASWSEIINMAYMERISLSACGFWKSNKITYDPVTRIGRRWNYYCYGAAASEVEIDVLTGEHQQRATHIVMDVGRSLNPAVDIGQVEGAFVQGLGLFTMEEPLFSNDGRLLTKGPGAYKIPGFRDIPAQLSVSLYDQWSNRHGLYHSKAVGEPPLFMGASVFLALRDAVEATMKNSDNQPMHFHSPATVATIRMTLDDERSKRAQFASDNDKKPWCVRP